MYTCGSCNSVNHQVGACQCCGYGGAVANGPLPTQVSPPAEKCSCVSIACRTLPDGNCATCGNPTGKPVQPELLNSLGIVRRS